MGPRCQRFNLQNSEQSFLRNGHETLAQDTQESTAEIQSLIEKLKRV